MIRRCPAIFFMLSFCFTIGQSQSFQEDEIDTIESESFKTSLSDGLLSGSITGVDPESATIPQSLTVEISGSGTHFAMGTGTSVWFSQGSSTVYSYYPVAMNNVLIQAELLFTNNHDPGYYDVNTLNEVDGHLVLADAFYLFENPNPPILTGISPESSQAGEIVIVTITAQYTHFDQGYNYVTLYKPGNVSMSATYVTVTDDETLEAEFHVPTNIASGFYNLQVHNTLDGNMGMMNVFEVLVDPDPPSLTGIDPDSGTIPETMTVTISGVDTHFNQGTGTFVYLKNDYYPYIYGQNITPLSDTEINATFHFDDLDDPGYYDVRTYSALDGYLDLYDAFYLNPNPNPPQLLSIDPDQAEPGQTLDVAISGQNSAFAQGTGTLVWIKLGNTFIYPNNINILSDELLDVNFYIANNAPTGLYTVNTLNNTVGLLTLPYAFDINYLVPELTNVIPDLGYIGDTILLEVTGENTHFLDAASSMLGWMSTSSQENIALSLTPVSNTSIEMEFALSPEYEAGLWNIGIQNDIDGEVFLQDGFEVIDTISNIGNNIELYTLQITPNPSQGVFSFSFESAVDKDIQVILLDQTGKILDEMHFAEPPIRKARLDLTAYPPGIYFVQVNFNGTSSAYKVIVTP